MNKAHIRSGLDCVELVDHLLHGCRIGLTNQRIDHSLRSGCYPTRPVWIERAVGCEHGVRMPRRDAVSSYVDGQFG